MAEKITGSSFLDLLDTVIPGISDPTEKTLSQHILNLKNQTTQVSAGFGGFDGSMPRDVHSLLSRARGFDAPFKSISDTELDKQIIAGKSVEILRGADRGSLESLLDQRSLSTIGSAYDEGGQRSVLCC